MEQVYTDKHKLTNIKSYKYATFINISTAAIFLFNMLYISFVEPKSRHSARYFHLEIFF